MLRLKLRLAVLAGLAVVAFAPLALGLEAPARSPQSAPSLVLPAVAFEGPADAGVPFYRETKNPDADTHGLAVNPKQTGERLATAALTYAGPSGTHTLRLHAVAEEDGESVYELVIDGRNLGRRINERVKEKRVPVVHEWKNVSLASGARLEVRFGGRSNGLYPEGNAFAWSRGRWRHLEILPAPDRAGQPPNILFILTDDQGWPTLSSYGNQQVDTPHLDRLAREGVRFTDAYATPQCTPTRGALLTGQHPARTRMWHVIPWYATPYGRLQEPEYRTDLGRSIHTLPKGLKAAGYFTGMAGKWHLSTNGDGDYAALNPALGEHYGFDYVAPRGPGDHNAGDKQVDHLTDTAIRFMSENRQRPWFFYLSHYTVHAKVSAPNALVRKYRERGAPEKGLSNATYLAAIEHLDTSIGRLLEALDRSGQRENTLVVFLSDNGGVSLQYDPRPFLQSAGATTTPRQLTPLIEEFPNAPLRMGKGSHYEGGIRVPCIARWPAAVKPQVSRTPVQVIDWLPTLYAAAGAAAPREHVLDGENLLPHLRGGTAPDRALYWYLPFYEVRWGATPAAIIRDGDWKLIEFFGDRFDADGRYQEGSALELYDLANDLGEQHNLATQHPQRAQQLHQKLRQWMSSLGAEVPGPNPRFDEPRQLLEVKQRP